MVPRPSASFSFQIPGLAFSWKYPKLLITRVSLDNVRESRTVARRINKVTQQKKKLSTYHRGHFGIVVLQDEFETSWG